jgi:hypothetical protein
MHACRFNMALEAARKGEDLWIDLSSNSLQLAKTKKVGREYWRFFRA